MSKRKEVEPDLDDEEDDDSHRRGHRSNAKNHQQEPQKVYDFHKKTVEVYPARLLELNRQFSVSIASQIASEPYSVLVGNCLDYVRQYFAYEDDLLKHSPWLAARLKQCHTGVVKCLQETIDVYEALARQDFDHLFDETCSIDTQNLPLTRPSNELSSLSTNKTDIPAQSTLSLGQFRPPTTTTTSSSFLPPFNFPKTPTTNIELSPPTSTFSFKMPTATTTTTTSASASSSPIKSTFAPPFAFATSNTGFGTNTFSSSNFGITTPKSTTLPSDTEKSPSGSAASNANSSFTDFKTTAPKFSFTPIAASGGDSQTPAATTEENEEESSEPPQPEKVDHEADAKLTYRCRMGVNKSGKMIKRGPVQVVLKETDGKHQLIVRSDDSLGRLFLNIIWSKLIEIKKHSSKDLTFICKLNPGMPEVAQGEFVMILLRFDNETERNDAHDKLGVERT